MGLSLIIVGALVAVIGLLKDNKARPGERAVIFGLDRTGTVLLLLSLVGVGLGVAQEVHKNREQRKQFEIAKSENLKLQRKLDSINQGVFNAQVSTSQIATSLLDKQPRSGELRFEQPGHLVRPESIKWEDHLSAPSWFTGTPWYIYDVSFLDDSNEQMTARFGDRLSLDMQYKPPIYSDEAFDGLTLRGYKYEHPQAPVAIVQVGTKLHFMSNDRFEFDVAHVPESGNSLEEMEIAVMLPGNVKLPEGSYVLTSEGQRIAPERIKVTIIRTRT